MWRGGDWLWPCLPESICASMRRSNLSQRRHNANVVSIRCWKCSALLPRRCSVGTILIWRHESLGANVGASGGSVWLTRYHHENKSDCSGASLHGVVIHMHMHPEKDPRSAQSDQLEQGPQLKMCNTNARERQRDHLLPQFRG